MKDSRNIQPMFADQLKPKGNAVNIEKVLSIIKSSWPVYLVCVIIALVIGYVYLRYSTPIYMVNAKLLINDQRKGMSDMDVLQDLGVRSRPANVENEMEIMKSKILMERVVSNLDLHIQYKADGTVKSSDLYAIKPVIFHPLFEDKDIKHSYKYSITVLDNNIISINENAKTWKVKSGDTVTLTVGRFAIEKNPIPTPVKEFDVIISPVEQIAARYNGGLLLGNPNRLMSVITLSIADDVVQRGEDVLNELIAVYMQASVDDRNRIANGTVEFINDRLMLVGTELTGIEKDIEGFKKDNELTDIKAQSNILLVNTSEYAKQLSEQQIKLSLVESLESYLRDNSNKRRIVPATLFGQDMVLSGIISKYNEVLAEYEKLLLTNTENNPYVISLDNQLINLRGDMMGSLASIKRQLHVSLNELNKMSGRVDAEIRQVPGKERVFLEFSRQQNIKQELYLFLLKKREETAISKSATTSDAKIIDIAKGSHRPVSPNRRVVLLSALVFGLLLPSVGIFVRELLNVRISSKDDVEQATRMAILAEIGHSNDEKVIEVKSDGRGQIAEQLRALRTNLQFLLTGENENVIMLTSSMSGEGKSFIAINLASILAVSGKKVLLMELDLRKPKVSINLGLNNTTGFSTYAIGSSTLEESIVPSGVYDNFFVMPSGPLPPNPSELIMLPRIAELFAMLKQQFDYIIIDTAPVGLVTDAQLLGKYASAVLYVVRQGYTFKQQLAAADELYRSGKMPGMNLVMNDVKAKRSGYGYGYGYYANGYFNEEEEGTRVGTAIRKLRRRITKR